MRVPMVTRTLSTTKCKIELPNDFKKKYEIIEVEVPGRYSDETKLIKAIKSVISNEYQNGIPKILETEVIEQLYGMTEAKFLENAKIIEKKES